MNWHYLEGSVQHGPVSDSDLDRLIQTGKVGDDSLVWREGMAEWLPLREARPTIAPTTTPASLTPTGLPGGVVCAECKGMFPPDQVIRHSNVFICASCKPVFLQKLKEGVAPTGTLRYAGFWVRFCAKVVDNILVRIVVIPLGFIIGRMLGPKDPIIAMMMGALSSICVLVCYSTLFVGKFGATPGKMATKLRIVNPDGSPVSYSKAFARCFGELVSGLILSFGYIMAAWDPEKRALHDRMCSTRVIRR